MSALRNWKLWAGGFAVMLVLTVGYAIGKGDEETALVSPEPSTEVTSEPSVEASPTPTATPTPTPAGSVEWEGFLAARMDWMESVVDDSKEMTNALEVYDDVSAYIAAVSLSGTMDSYEGYLVANPPAACYKSLYDNDRNVVDKYQNALTFMERFLLEFPYGDITDANKGIAELENANTLLEASTPLIDAAFSACN